MTAAPHNVVCPTCGRPRPTQDAWREKQSDLTSFIRFAARSMPREWKVCEMIRLLRFAKYTATRREIYNRIGYLARRGEVHKLGYARYIAAQHRIGG